MKLTFLLGLLFCQIGFAYNAIVNCTSANLPLTYAITSPSLQPTLTGLYLRSNPTLMLINPSATRICANTVTSSILTAPTAGNGNEHCIAAGTIAFFDLIDVPRGPANIYLRSDAASCTSTILDVDIW
jgi:hypothetical protein